MFANEGSNSLPILKHDLETGKEQKVQIACVHANTLNSIARSIASGRVGVPTFVFLPDLNENIENRN